VIFLSVGSRVRVGDIAGKPPITARPSMTIGDLLPKMRELKVRVVPVVNDGNRLIGVLSYKGILMRGVGRFSKVGTVMEPPYAVEFSSSVDEVIAKFVVWKAKALPVVGEGRELVGYISRVDVLKFLLDNNLLPDRVVGNVMSAPPTVIREGESIARARWLMLRGGISRLPVIRDGGDDLTGVISMTDIVERLYLIRLTRRKGFEQFEEEFLAAPVREFMSSPPIHVFPNTKLTTATSTLIKYGVTGMPVVEGSRVVGVVSGIDILRAYAEAMVSKELIEAKVPNALRTDEVAKAQAETLVNEFLSNIRRVVNVIDFNVKIKEEGKGGRKRFVVRVKLVTNEGAYATEGSGWDLLSSLREALIKLEGRVKKYKKKLRDMRRGRSSVKG